MSGASNGGSELLMRVGYDRELIREIRWDALNAIETDWRTIRASEGRQLFACLRDACDMLDRFAAEVESGT